MNAVIIEDEKRNMQFLRTLVEKHCSQLKIVGAGFHADEGIELISEHRPELVFLDIQMPRKSGFDMLSELGEYEFEVIFVTGYDHYALQAIKFSALDYLLKPIKTPELVRAVGKAETSYRRKKTNDQILNMLSILNNQRKSDHRIALPLMKEILFVRPEEIVRCESINNYTRFFLANGKMVIVSKGIYEYEKLLKEYCFIRCHQSHLVNRLFIRSLLKKDIISELLLTDGSTIPVSKPKREWVKEQLMK